MSLTTIREKRRYERTHQTRAGKPVRRQPTGRNQLREHEEFNRPKPFDVSQSPALQALEAKLAAIRTGNEFVPGKSHLQETEGSFGPGQREIPERAK